MMNHMVPIIKDGARYKLARYYAPSLGPRPESYREDYHTAENLYNEEEKIQLYIELKSGAETGSDFSTRWIIKNGTNEGNLSNIRTTDIIPVDLNAFLHQNARMLSHFYYLLGDSEKAENFRLRAEKHLKAIHAVLWHRDRGIWLDYDMRSRQPRDYFYLSNLTPLWTDSYLDSRAMVSRSVLAYLKDTGADSCIGGLPTSLYESGLQWDLPNGWPPLQGIAIQGLDRLGTSEAKNMARALAEKWISTNYVGFKRYNAMFEKYNVTTVGETGNGGEYVYQTGFGWTNGVILQLLDMFPNSTPDSTDGAQI